ncbi:MAG: S8 family serine peptidase [Hyphomicrobiaceae bacterium]
MTARATYQSCSSGPIVCKSALCLILAALFVSSPVTTQTGTSGHVLSLSHPTALAGRGGRNGRRGDRDGKHGHKDGWGGWSGKGDDKSDGDDSSDGDNGDVDSGDGDSGDGDSGSAKGKGDGKAKGQAGDNGQGDADGGQSGKGGKSAGKGGKSGKKSSTQANASTSDTDSSTGKTSSKKGKKAAKPTVPAPVVTVAAPQGASGLSITGDHRSGEVVGVGMSTADVAAVSAMGFTVAPAAAQPAATEDVVELLVPRGMEEEAARQLLAAALPGRRFGLNRVYSGYGTANSGASRSGTPDGGRAGADPRCSGDQCYGRVMIGWQSNLEACSSGVSIGMIDTGIDIAHPVFAGRSLVVQRFSPPDAEEEVYSHATGVAALLIGNGTEAAIGLLPNSKLVVADVFYVDNDKRVVTDTASLLRALDWLDAAGVRIVNMSFSGPEDPLVAQSIERMSKKGVVFVAAAGNNGPAAAAAYPAAYDSVIAVTAVDSRMKSYVKANHGDYIDVAAPGVKIWTALAGDKAGYQSGTSFAVPFVTASLAASSAYGEPGDVRSWLGTEGIDDIGEPGVDPVFGRGLLKAPSGCGGFAQLSGLLSNIFSGDATNKAQQRMSIISAER